MNKEIREINVGDLVEVSVAKYNPWRVSQTETDEKNHCLALVIDVGQKNAVSSDFVFSPSKEYEIFVMFVDDNKKMWIPSKRLKKVE
jgi:hypothetical protein